MFAKESPGSNTNIPEYLLFVIKLIYFLCQKFIAIFAHKYSPKLALPVSSARLRISGITR